MRNSFKFLALALFLMFSVVQSADDKKSDTKKTGDDKGKDSTDKPSSSTNTTDFDMITD